MAITALLFIALLPAITAAQSAANDNSVKAQMHNVTYHFTNNVAVSIRDLRGALFPEGKHQVPVFDDKNSFILHIDSAEIAISTASMANVLNSHVFSRPDSPIKNVSIQIDKDRLKIKGKLHNKGNVPFETDGTLSATPEGKIRVHTEKVKALHLPVKGLMDLLGINVDDLVKNGKMQGIQVEKDDLILDPEQILPPPHIRGKVTNIRLVGDSIVQTYGSSAKAPSQMPVAGNFMAYSGNQLRFGKLTMSDTDMILIDMDPKDPFDFYLDHYKEQLTAGYTKTTASFGLRVYMRDFNKLQRGGKKKTR